MFKLKTCKDYTVTILEDNSFRIKLHPNNKDIKDLLKSLYELENIQVRVLKTDPEYGKFKKKYKYPTIYLDLKGLKPELIAEAIKFSFTYNDLRDPLMILNIINLCKGYNSLDKSYFDHPDTYCSSLNEFLKVKLSIKKEKQEFLKRFSIYFLSLLKSLNKEGFAPAEYHEELPKLFQTIFMSSDIVTLSSMFELSPDFDTSECKYIDEAFKYVSSFITKSSIGIALMNNFLDNFLIEKPKKKVGGVKKNGNRNK